MQYHLQDLWWWTIHVSAQVSSLFFDGTELAHVIDQLLKESSSTNINTLHIIIVAANSVSSHEILAAPGACFIISRRMFWGNSVTRHS